MQGLLIKPCRGSDALKCDLGAEVDLKGMSATLKKRGYAKKIAILDMIIMAKGEKEVTIYDSGKLIFKGHNKWQAENLTENMLQSV